MIKSAGSFKLPVFYYKEETRDIMMTLAFFLFVIILRYLLQRKAFQYILCKSSDRYIQ